MAREGDVSEAGVERLTVAVALVELIAVPRQRPVAVLAPGPRRVGVDIDPDDEMSAQRLSDRGRRDRPTAE